MRHLALAAALCFALTAEARVSSYVFVRGHTRMTSNVDLARALHIRASAGDNFVWFRADGKAYIVRDAKTLDAIDHLFDGTRAVEPEYESLRQKRQPFEDREEQLEREIDPLEHRVDELGDDENETASDRGERNRLENRIRDLEHDVRDVEVRLREFDDIERELDRKQDELERQAERAMEPILERAVRDGIAINF
jgi:septal ring factor EnvC (AmiA/AmiB activator)